MVLRNYLYSHVDKLLDQTALCLGNIIVETNEFRDTAINLGILDRAVNLSKDTTKPVELIKNCMFLISNLLRGKPKPQLEKVYSEITLYFIRLHPVWLLFPHVSGIKMKKLSNLACGRFHTYQMDTKTYRTLSSQQDVSLKS
jgi:hypothetical protein